MRKTGMRWWPKICRSLVRCQACTCGIRIHGYICLFRKLVRRFARIVALNITLASLEAKFL